MAIRKLKPTPTVEPTRMPEALDILPVPLLLWDQKNQELFANTEFVRSYGAVENHQFDEAKPVYELNARPLNLQLFSSEGRHEGFALKNKENQKKQIEAKVKRYGKSTAQNFVIMIEEVDSKIELQQQLIDAHLQLQRSQRALIQSEKLASLGELSSGIAHELNQPLQAILGFSQELTETEKLSKNGMEFLTDIRNAAVKMRDIIKSLRTFARDAGNELSATSIEHAVLESKKLTHYQFLQRGIIFEVVSEKNLPFIKANAIQLEQVIVNLINNARDAVEQTGRKDGKVVVSIRKAKSGVTLEVQDNGCGMSDETKVKIFNPFFTTKEIGKGTGLGLSITYGILKNFGAEIEVTSTAGKGTTFTINFKTIESEK